jgi:hypothetical protein
MNIERLGSEDSDIELRTSNNVFCQFIKDLIRNIDITNAFTLGNLGVWLDNRIKRSKLYRL